MIERLHKMAKTGGVGKNNLKIMRANEVRSPTRLTTPETKAHVPIRARQTAKVAFLLEMTDKAE